MTLGPQYHFRRTPNGLLIWNASRLVDLVQGVPIVDVPLSEINELEKTYWFGDAGNNEPTCRAIADHMKLIDSADLTYPVILCAEGRVMDGMHRP